MHKVSSFTVHTTDRNGTKISFSSLEENNSLFEIFGYETPEKFAKYLEQNQQQIRNHMKKYHIEKETK